MRELTDRIEGMLLSEPDPEKNYYALTILLGSDYKPQYSSFSHFAGYTDESRRYELREASLVLADRMLNGWRTIGEPGLVINTIDEFGLFFQFGGHAVVEQNLAEVVVPEWLVASPTVHVGERGFASPACLPASALQRAPTSKLRMAIIKRDRFRCRVCGRSPNDHVDLELHVHHIRPWAAGGVTEDSNLITLCHTCHKGLDPHFEHSLFLLLPKANSARASEYREALKKYQVEASPRSKEADV
jgi:hypothetical protein